MADESKKTTASHEKASIAIVVAIAIMIELSVFLIGKLLCECHLFGLLLWVWILSSQESVPFRPIVFADKIDWSLARIILGIRVDSMLEKPSNCRLVFFALGIEVFCQVMKKCFAN